MSGMYMGEIVRLIILDLCRLRNYADSRRREMLTCLQWW